MSQSSLISRKITYLRQCYQADNRAVVITDFLGKKVEKPVWMEGEEQVLTGFYPASGLPAKYPKNLLKSLLINQQEQMVIKGAFFLTGRPKEETATALLAPLVMYPLELFVSEQDEDLVMYRVNFAQRQINHYVLRSLLPDDAELSAKLDALERLIPRDALDFRVTGEVVRWFAKHLPGVQTSDALMYPTQLQSAKAMKAEHKTPSESLQLLSAVAMGVVSRSRDTLGILSETETLSKLPAEEYAAPLRQLLGSEVHTVPEVPEAPMEVPASLNHSQRVALHNARSYPISVVQGPPGTGKSFTIANMALEHMSRGESVLIATRTQEALEVVAEKVEGLVDDREMIVRTGGGWYLRQLQQRVLRLTRSATPVSWRGKPLSKMEQDVALVHKALQDAEELYNRRLRKELSLAPWHQKPHPQGVKPWRRLIRQMQATLHRRRTAKALPQWRVTQTLGQLQQKSLLAKGLILRARYVDQLLQLMKAGKFPALEPFLKALKTKNLAESAEAYAHTDFDLVTQVFPIWLVNLNDIYQNLPMRKEMFDVVIVDEATQVDMTSVLPLFQRARRVVIVGDVHQLRHVSFLAKERQRTMAEQLQLSYMDRLDYRNESILDLAMARMASGRHGVMLQEHYRSHPSIIGFSNRALYEESLHIMTQRPFPQPTELHLVRTKGQRVAAGYNKVEADEIVKRVLELIDYEAALPEADVQSVGILSPLAAQAEYLNKAIVKALTLPQMQRHHIQVGTPYAFQGAERDVMFISLAVDPDSHPSAYHYLSRPDVLNVAITRARDQQWVFFSGDQDRVAKDALLGRYMAYAQEYEQQYNQRTVPQDVFLDEVLAVVEKQGWKAWPHYLFAGLVVDLVLQTPTATFGVNLVGHPGPYQAGLTPDQLAVLHRSGLPIFTLSYTEWLCQQLQCVNALKKFSNLLHEG